MILVDKPYISDFLRATISKYGFPVVKTEVARELGFNEGSHLLDVEDAIRHALSTENLQIYTTSENSIGWIAKHLSGTDLPAKIDLFKDKAKFRNLLEPLYPDFYFRTVQLNELDRLDIGDLPRPFIIKPTVGFFSLGVYKVTDAGEWERTKASIRKDAAGVANVFPKEVLDTAAFIIEECIEGTEYAIDAYYDAAGEPVILTILKHIFASKADVSDRVYISSKAIIEGHIDQFSAFLSGIGRLASIRNFPVHVEVRLDERGNLSPIEVNPMRFGGWCTTADMTYHAYGFNPYAYYFSQKRPDWSQILEDKTGNIYSIIVLDNTTGLDANQITAFDYDRLLTHFEKPLELRRIDYTQYPVFGFLFAETREENFAELEHILASNLREFVRIASPDGAS
jgi:hypothetical protein